MSNDSSEEEEIKEHSLTGIVAAMPGMLLSHKDMYSVHSYELYHNPGTENFFM